MNMSAMSAGLQQVVEKMQCFETVGTMRAPPTGLDRRHLVKPRRIASMNHLAGRWWRADRAEPEDRTFYAEGTGQWG